MVSLGHALTSGLSVFVDFCSFLCWRKEFGSYAVHHHPPHACLLKPCERPSREKQRRLSHYFNAFATCCVLCLGLLLVSSAAQAGYYHAEYSGGSWLTSWTGGDYGLDQNHRYGVLAGDYDSDPFGDCSGAITVTFTWVPSYVGDLPPASCIVEENCDADAEWLTDVQNTPQVPVSSLTGSLSVDPGLPQTFVDQWTTDLATSRHSYLHKRGRQFKIKNEPGQSFQIDPPCSPASSASATTPIGASSYTFCSIWYTASAYPIVVGLSGTTPQDPNLYPWIYYWQPFFDGVLNILIGQGCTSQLIALPEEFGNSFAGYFDNYLWDISGDTFKNYEAHDLTTSGWYQGQYRSGWAQVTYLTLDDLKQPSPTFFWRGQKNVGSPGQSSGDETVTGSASAFIQIPGQPAPLQIGRVTGERSISVWEPYYFFNYRTGISGTYWDWNPGSALLHLVFASGDYVSTFYGCEWWGKVIAPDLFLPSPHIGNGQYWDVPNGNWSLVQTVQYVRCHRTQIVDPGPPKVTRGQHDPQIGVYALDNDLPYGGIAQWPADDRLGNQADTPNIAVIYQSLIAQDVDVDLDLYTYMMYQPDNIGPGNMWVPLRRLYWYWTSQGLYTPNPFTANTPYGLTIGTGDLAWKYHPVWEHVDTNSAMVDD